MPSEDVAWNYPVSLRAMPNPGVGYPRLTAPYAASPHCWGFARLACLIHAANVRSEPGSNPSKVFATPPKWGSLTSSGLPARVRTETQSHPTSGRPLAGPAGRRATSVRRPHGKHPPPARLHLRRLVKDRIEVTDCDHDKVTNRSHITVCIEPVTFSHSTRINCRR